MSESRAIISRQPAGGVALIGNLEDAAKMAKYVTDSGLFGCKNPAEALVKIVAGHEMGFPAIAAMTDIHIIEGKPSVGAHLMAAAIRRSGKYDFEIREHTEEVCTIAFFQNKGGVMKEVGVVTTTIKQAKDNGWTLTAGGKEKPTWRTKPKNMLFARTISDGYKWYCPDLTGGMLVYDRDEIEQEPAAAVVVSKPKPVQIEHQPAGPLSSFDSSDDPERPTDLSVNDDGSLRSSMCERTETCQRVEALVRELGFSAEQMKKKLAKDYGGAESVHKLDLAGVQKLENELLAVRSKRLAASSAPASK